MSAKGTFDRGDINILTGAFCALAGSAHAANDSNKTIELSRMDFMV
jgi:hypothetical protein